MTRASISLVLPVDGPDEALAPVIASYAQTLERADVDWQLVLVPAPGSRSGEAAASACARVAAEDERIAVTAPVAGWGAAVSAGLGQSGGQLLGYSSWQRTPARALAEMVELAIRNPELVLRANRRTRDTRLQRLGSLAFNLECRLLLQIPVWDVNGTPKIFPRAFSELLAIRRTDDLFDAAFAVACERSGYPVMEVPIDAERVARHAGKVGLTAALRMYLSVPSLSRRAGA
jgi:hypothetical protein